MDRIKSNKLPNKEVFSEVALFGNQTQKDSESVISADCSCFTCDGNPCIEGTD